MSRSTHSVHYVVEEKLAVRRDHHDLQFVREALSYDFVDQQRILFQDRGLARHAFGIGGGGQTNALCLGLRQKFATLSLGFAVDKFGFAGSLGILDRGFFSRFGFELRLLDLFLFHREPITHWLGLSLGFG